MAFSQPLTDSVRRKGQSAMLCQLCENDPKLKWKCLQCELMMCQRCKEKVHPKFPSAKTHTIIDIKEISKHQTDSELKPDLTRIYCTVHSGQRCCFYCKTCQELVCQTCIIKTHNKHEFGDINNEYEIKIEKLRNGQKNIEREMRTLKVSEQKLKQIKSNELQVDKSFETDLMSIDSIVSCPDGSLWICDRFSDRVQKVNTSEDSIIVISDFGVNHVFDAALLPSGDLLLSDPTSFNLKLILYGFNDIQDSVYTVSPLYQTGVHVTCDNKVIAGAVNTFAIPATGPRQVIVMDQTGHHEKVLQYDNHNKPLFTYPYRITSNSQGNIAVVDLVSDDNFGRVVVLDQEGEVRNIYIGHSDVNEGDNPFTPLGITTTPSDNFVVADRDNHTLHILNSEGKIITFYNTMEMGILLPQSLSFSTTGQLYIGCNTYGNSEENAKLFIVNNFLY